MAANDAKKNDAKKNKHSIENITQTISRVSQTFSHGKAYRLLLEEGGEFNQHQTDETHSKVRTPGHFSDTRFATYSSDVLKKWLHNYKFYYRRLNKEADDELLNIDNASFMLSCAGLSDIYEVIGKLSNAVQKPDIPPWDSDSLSDSLFPVLSNMFKQVSEKGEYETCPIFVRKISVHGTRRRNIAEDSVCVGYDDSLKVACKNLQSFVSDVHSNMKTRFGEEE